MIVFRINFKLKKPAEITPWGELQPTLHWFGLTDSLLWIDISNSVIYEYTEAYTDECGNSVKYNEYQLSRFLEDFSEILPSVSRSVPKLFYDAIENFEKDTKKWESLYIDEDDETFENFYEEGYEPLTSWFYMRCIDSGHLVQGPQIGFFRCDDNIKIWWDSENYNQHSIWRFPSGCFEIVYSEFVSEVERFFSSFYKEMDKQVEEITQNGIPGVYVDNDALIQENKLRKDGFYQKVASLKNMKKELIDWKDIMILYDRMRAELYKR